MTGAPFRVVVSDPPWKFSDSIGKRGAAANYTTLTVHQLCDFPLPRLSRNCFLFLWRVASMQEEALMVMRSWGFTLKTEIVWEKTTKKSGLDHFGMGRIVRASHETCLVGVRGNPKVRDRSVRSRFSAPVGRHSEKPEFFYRDVVERLSRGPYVEMFARKRREGWTTLGDEVPEPTTTEGP